MNILVTNFRNIVKSNVRYMSHSHHVVANYEILYKKFKDLLYQQHLTDKSINEIVKKIESIEKKIKKLEKK